MCCTPSGYITFNLRNLKFYEGREPRAGYEDRGPETGYEGRRSGAG